MPGYRALSRTTGGDAASETRIAEAVQRHGDLPSATRLLEAALVASADVNRVLPGWLCGRLAALYRSQGRYDDEVHLLERYRESQVSDDCRTRYDARLSKASAIAHKRRRSDSTALSSIRGIAKRRRTEDPVAERTHAQPAPFSDHAIMALRAALTTPPADPYGRLLLRNVIGQLCDEARSTGQCAEQLVVAIRAAWNEIALSSGASVSELRTRYEQALAWCISVYFDEPEPEL